VEREEEERGVGRKSAEASACGYALNGGSCLPHNTMRRGRRRAAKRKGYAVTGVQGMRRWGFRGTCDWCVGMQGEGGQSCHIDYPRRQTQRIART
jgi:hypothetical protein